MINWNRVDELREEVGNDDFQEVADLFLEEVDEVIQRLIDAPDPATYEEDLHFLKGSALNLGFSDFSDLCATGEKMSAVGNAASVEIAAVIECYQVSRGQFTSQLGLTAAA